MTKRKDFYCRLMTIMIVPVIFLSCNNSGDVPFPEKELSYLQPVTLPLQFSVEKKLTWDTAKSGGINPTIKKLDIDALPAIPFDTAGYEPFAKPPEEVRFDYASLPATDINLDSLPSKPIQFKTSILSLPPAIKTITPSPLAGNPLSLFEFGPTHGLQAKIITGLLKDEAGLMWIAGLEGIFRYDGENVQTYVSASPDAPLAGLTKDNMGRIWYIREKSIGLIDPHAATTAVSNNIGSQKNNVAKMVRSADGLIWVANDIDKSISIIDPVTMTFKSIDKKAGLSDSVAFGILEDNNKNIWITTYTGGVNIVDLKSGKIKYLKKSSGLGNDSLSAIAMDKTGKVWLAHTGTGMDEVNIKDGIIKHYNQLQGLKKRFVLNLSVDNKSRVWAGTNQGIELINTEKGTIRYLTPQNGISGNTITSTLTDNNDREWVATTQGINIIAQNGETVYPLGTTTIISLMDDSSGNLWVATDHGILIIDPKKKLARTLNKLNGLGNDFVQSFLRSGQQMWVTTNGGLDVIDLAHKTIEHTGKKEGLINDTTYAVFKDKHSNTWLAGPSNGVNLVDSAKKMIRHTGTSGGLSDYTIQDIKQDHNGLVWLATNRGGINVIDLVAGTVKYLINQPGLRDTCYRMMLLDKNGRMWIGTDKGIYVADTKAGTITSINTSHGLASNRILSLLEYGGSVIAGTNKKVNIITPPGTGTETGETNIPGSEWKVTVLNRSEGLVRQQTNSWNTDLITGDGQYLWGDRGLTVIKDIQANNDTIITYVTGITVMTQPQYFANKHELANKDTIWAGDTFYIKGTMPADAGYKAAKGLSWDSVSGPYNMPANLQLPYRNNYVQFRFTQAHLGRSDTTWYCYFLEGIDKNWSEVTNEPFTENYLNLPPGTYTFKVSSKGVSGKWSIPAAFSFTISPPWYKTWWAYILFALLAIGILRAYIVYRSRMLQKENKLLEEKVSLRTNQLQQSLEDLKATQVQLIQSEKMASLGELTAGIAHEIQNPLNFVNNFSEVNTELIAEMKDELDKGNLEDAKAIADDIAANEEKINQHGKRADAIVKGMLLHSRRSSGVKEPIDINALADEYLRLAYHGLRAKDKTFNASMKTDFDKSIGNINIIPQDIGRVILNLITNAFYAVNEKKKQATEPYEPTIFVSTKKTNGNIEVSIRDNGNGIPQKVLDKIFQPFFTTKPTGEGTGLGLSMSYDIVTKGHGGELQVETIDGQGAVFTIKLPVV
ncbi:MAG: two-component regulator propeller domain-containing protein [Ferruginibacter sp.]